MTTNTARADVSPTVDDQRKQSPDEEVPQLIGIGATARLLRPVWPHLIACATFSAVAAAAGAVPFVAIAEISRVLVTEGTEAASATVWAWAGAGAACAWLRLLLLGLSTHVGHKADTQLVRHLRLRIVRHLGVVPLGWFRAVGSGRVKKAVNEDLEAMHELVAHAVGGLVGAVTSILVGVGYLVSVDWRMALVTLAVPALGVLSYRWGMRSLSAQIPRLLAAESQISAASVEYVDGISVVKTFGGGGGGRVLDRFADAVREHVAAHNAWLAGVRASSMLNRALGSELTVLAVVLAAGLGFVGAGWLRFPDVLPFLVVGIGLPTSFGPVLHGAHGVRMARVAAGSIERLLAQEPLPEPANPRRPTGHRVELDRVTFSYDGVSNAVEEISAVCEPGTVTAIVGPSGAGKSTLASLVPRFYDVTGGAIRIGGVDVRQMSSATLLSSMSLVFQDVVLLRDTVRENIRIGRPDATHEEVLQAAKAAQVHDVIERLPHGYDTMLGTGESGLSGGEQQRLTIARAILSGAPIVILDEATASLDPDSEAAVQQALTELVAGRTVLVIAHRLHTITAADQILVLDRGRLVETGTHQELLARNGLYARMWRAQRNGDNA
ncbi:ATP-binding cassette, subfamily B [Streptoalloteichus tenebrarius]|uniref:ATP-binding cassette, subfamily B n=1 Tax=Streptoalloteichus tenebrarius (strain ATCC 17920 / DSM 40477 / JCM 4838 / CBS 697.72 / NBRC 16177 / NCIMB 11028 / NRRL B-12390 / A12253. 1 / ISP 5477) TaxID=1933 RepID=A0ABT1HWB2_STRSD|nr:ABC transporter ATP-binding protein [Streptoalloteichus tenebrarius]MCP2259792.1 ATP-binding cassette, subfamily B [Streptoalloteichus tenebrarius]BFE99262.1 ABC transporter ATP-binding protein [Streptoalloteichus tenebrarius]